jgi:ABC-type transport system involved in multi-copper enzyme maturation permease subunit
MRQVMSNAVSRDVVLVAKWLGAFVVLATTVIALLATTFALLMGQPDVLSTAGDAWRMAAVALVALLLGAAMLSLGLLVSCRCRQSSHALVILLFLWVLAAVVIPSLAPYTAGFLRPVPGAAEELQKRLQLTLEYEPAHGDGTMDPATFQRRLGQLQEAHQQRLAHQMELIRTLSYLSPVATAAHVLADLAGTGLEAQVRVGQAVRHFRDRYAAFTETIWEGDANARRPELRLPPATAAETTVSLRAGITVLTLYTVALFLAGHLAFLRKDLTR